MVVLRPACFACPLLRLHKFEVPFVWKLAQKHTLSQYQYLNFRAERLFLNIHEFI